MSDDLKERLREAERTEEAYVVGGQFRDRLCREARGALDARDDELSRLRAQNEALVGALEEIRHRWAGHSEACAFVAGIRLGTKKRCDCDWPKLAARADAALSQAKEGK